MGFETRFLVGEEVVVAGFVYANDFIGRLNTFERPLGCVVKTLVIKEHHRVPGNYEIDNKPKYDGFIAEDKATKEVYFNQYPRAKYGQVTDTEDRVFISPEKFLKFREKLYTLSELLDDVVTHMKSDTPYEITESLKAHFELFLKEFEKTLLGKTIEIIPLVLKDTNGKDIPIPGHYTTAIVDK